MGSATKRRGKQEIYVDVLRATETTSISLRIMLAANVAWAQVTKEIFPHLVKEGLIVESASDKSDKRTNRIYHLTAKGKAVLVAQDTVARGLRL